MKRVHLVIDTNCLISGILRNSISRHIILNDQFRFFAPERLLVEIIGHHGQMMARSGLDHREYSFLLVTLLERIELVPYERYDAYFARSFETMANIDENDATFLALGLALRVDGIWTDDKHFQKQHLLKVFSTGDLLEMLE